MLSFPFSQPQHQVIMWAEETLWACGDAGTEDLTVLGQMDAQLKMSVRFVCQLKDPPLLAFEQLSDSVPEQRSKA